MILAVLNGFSSVTSVVRPSDAASRSTMGCTSLPARTIIGAASAAAISAASASSVMRAISPLAIRIVVGVEPLLVLCGWCALLSLLRALSRALRARSLLRMVTEAEAGSSFSSFMVHRPGVDELLHFVDRPCSGDFGLELLQPRADLVHLRLG